MTQVFIGGIKESCAFVYFEMSSPMICVYTACLNKNFELISVSLGKKKPVKVSDSMLWAVWSVSENHRAFPQVDGPGGVLSYVAGLSGQFCETQ